MTYPIADGDAYYVAAREGGQTAAIAGPYASHSVAAAHVDRVRAAVAARYPADARAHFADYGVCLVPGSVAARLGLREV